MNRQDFYLNLALELNNLKVPPELINTHIDQFKQYLQTLSEADAEKQIASFGDVKLLAANIYRLLCGGEDAPAPAKKTPVKTEEESVYDAFRVEEEDEDIVTLLDDTTVVPSEQNDIDAVDDSPVDIPTGPIASPAESSPPPTAEEAVPAEEEDAGGEQLEMDFGIYDTGGYVAPDPAAFGDIPSSADTVIMDAPLPKNTVSGESSAEEDEEPFTEFTFEDLPKRRERSTGGLILFYSSFILTLPVTLTLFAVSMALFGVLYLVLGLATGLFFALIFGTAVAGALFALSGGLYGVGQLNVGGRAIGLFELGLALVIVGVTILVCFLFSMISLKWLPALLKYLTVFLRFYLSKLLTLFKYLKGRCEQL